MSANQRSTPTSVRTLRRLPLYLNHLKSLDSSTLDVISAPTIAKALNLNEVQVRKDLATIKSGGKPRTGYKLKKLIADLEAYLGYGNVDEAILVGVGHLGRALLSYKGFDAYGLDIVVAFDTDDSVIGSQVAGKKVLPLDKMPGLCTRMHVGIGIITVPSESAQAVCDMMVAAGIEAIWNFAPVQLVVPDGVIVQNENMASSLAVLAKHLKEKNH